MSTWSDAAPLRPRLWPRIVNALLALGAVAVSLLAFELGVRWFVDLRKLAPISVYDVDFTTRIAFLPERERQYTTEEFQYTIKTNRFGRRDREWTDAEIADPGNVLFVGDSFVMGASLEDAHTIPTQLETWSRARGRPREFFNFGMASTGLPQYIQILEDALRIGVGARTVLLGIFVGNDFEARSLDPNANLPPVSAATPRFAPHSALLDFMRLRISSSERLVGLLLRLDEWLGIRLYNTDNSYIFLRKPPAEKEEVFARILAALGRFDEICREHGRDLYVVIFPNRMQVENRDNLSSSVYDAERPNRLLAEYCASRGLRCFDELPALSQAWTRKHRPLFFAIDRHFNPAGSQVAADSLSAWLESANALGPEDPPLQVAAPRT